MSDLKDTGIASLIIKSNKQHVISPTHNSPIRLRFKVTL